MLFDYCGLVDAKIKFKFTSEDVAGKKELSEYEGFGELVMLSSDIQADNFTRSVTSFEKRLSKMTGSVSVSMRQCVDVGVGPFGGLGTTK